MRNTLIIFILVLFTSLIAGQIEFNLYQSKPKVTKRIKRYLYSAFHENKWKNDSINLFKFLNGEYYGEINVGSPAKKFKFSIDTTWADIWLPSSHCPWTEIVCRLHNRYDSSKSSSYIPNGRFINITSKDLSLSGFLATDTFHLAHVKVENQTFLEATHISSYPFLNYWSDGILGLAYQNQSGWAGVTPFFYNMIKQGIIQEQMFTFYMNRDETTERAGKVILGGKQRKHVKTDTLTTLEVVEKKFWKIEVDSIFAKKNNTDYPITSTKCRAIFDSSENTIVGPPAQIEKLNYMLNAVLIPKINRYTVNCREYAKLPTVHFVLKGNEFIIQSKYYVQRLTLDYVEACFSPFIPSSNPDQDFWELGGAFMMEFYTEFDMANNVVNIGETIF